MPTDRERWDARYAREDPRSARVPDGRVTAAIEALQPQPLTALDLAAGSGRHSLWLATRGIVTEAWDVSPVALDLIMARAQVAGLTIATQVVDLAGGLPTTAPRDLVLMVDYLERGLFPHLCALLQPKGVAVVCTFTDDFKGEHPSQRFRLRVGELRGLPGLRTEHATEHNGRALLVARRV
ncbi:MAG TPA: class I SAM-dependent methyltransferase [Polyangiaceae bacterium]|nr:class I SAM-dependent methyltransferase [Polyangiaceae bacterium]